MNKLNTGIIVLGAGASSRMGRSKQLLKIDGNPLLVLSVEAAVSSVARRTVVVLGANHEEHIKIIKNFPIDIVINDGWKNGIGNSLKSGLKFLLNSDTVINSVIILVCDQPMICTEHINKLIDKHQETHQPVIASGYAQTAGVPVFFDQSYFSKLLHLEDDMGAKKIIRENMADVVIVEFPQGEIDLDTAEDYERFQRAVRNRPGSGNN